MNDQPNSAGSRVWTEAEAKAWLGPRLQQLRRAAGLRVVHAAAHLECSPAKITALEARRARPKLRDVRDLLDLYQVPDPERAELLAAAAVLKRPGATAAELWPRRAAAKFAGRSIDEIAPLLDARVRDGETLERVAADYGVTREWIRQVVRPDAARCGMAVRRARKVEPQRVAAEVRAVQTALRLGPCAVCWGPVTGGRGRGERVRWPTCGGRCYRLWQAARIHLAADAHEDQRRRQAIWNLNHSAREVVLLHSAKLLTEGVAPNRRYIIPGSRASQALHEARRLRAATVAAGETWWLTGGWPDTVNPD